MNIPLLAASAASGSSGVGVSVEITPQPTAEPTPQPTATCETSCVVSEPPAPLPATGGEPLSLLLPLALLLAGLGALLWSRRARRDDAR